MGWSNPRDWTVGEVVTETMMDTHIKDNLRYLKGLDGAVTLSDALILPDGAGYYLHVPILTTTQRDNLTPTAGMLIYNSTTTQFNKYENAAWRADLAYNGDISTLQIASQAEGDILYRGASAWARLAKGTALYYLRQNAGLTAPEWATAPASGFTIFGDGSDGDVTIAADTPLTRDMFYNNLTVNTTKILTTAGYRIFVLGTLTNNGTIRRNGNAASGITAGAALAEGSLGGSAAGGAGNTAGGKTSGGGGSGGGIVFIAAKTIVNTSGVISANGGAGGNGSGTFEGANNGSAGSAISSSLGGNGGAGGTKDGTGGAGGAVTAPTAGMGGFRTLPFATILKEIESTVVKVAGGGGGGGGGNSNTGTYGACGGGGGGGGLVVMIYDSLTAGTEQASGGSYGSPSGDAAVGVAGSAGVVIKIANT